MLKSTQIGGKGTVRRKIKKTGHFFKEKITEECRIYINKINNINKKIKLIDNESYEKFKIYLDNELEDIGLAIEKNDLRKNKKDELEEIKDDRLNYMYNLIIKSVDKPIELDEKCYNKIKKLFEEDLLEIIKNFFVDLETCLEKNTYLNKK